MDILGGHSLSELDGQWSCYQNLIREFVSLNEVESVKYDQILDYCKSDENKNQLTIQNISHDSCLLSRIAEFSNSSVAAFGQRAFDRYLC